MREPYAPTLADHDRLKCAIAGCRHTLGARQALKRFAYMPREWICGQHWARLTREERRVWHRIKRLQRRFGCEVRASASDRIWSGLKRKAAQ